MAQKKSKPTAAKKTTKKPAAKPKSQVAKKVEAIKKGEEAPAPKVIENPAPAEPIKTAPPVKEEPKETQRPVLFDLPVKCVDIIWTRGTAKKVIFKAINENKKAVGNEIPIDFAAGQEVPFEVDGFYSLAVWK